MSSDVPDLISTDTTASLGTPYNPTDQNLRAGGIAVGGVAIIGVLLAVRNSRFTLEILTATFGLSLGAAYIALHRKSPGV